MSMSGQLIYYPGNREAKATKYSSAGNTEGHIIVAFCFPVARAGFEPT
jgi:hypothetical protein